MQASLDGPYWRTKDKDNDSDSSSSIGSDEFETFVNETDRKRKIREDFRREHGYEYHSEPEEQERRSEHSRTKAMPAMKAKYDREREKRAKRSEKALDQPRTSTGKFAKRT